MKYRLMVLKKSETYLHIIEIKKIKSLIKQIFHSIWGFVKNDNYKHEKEIYNKYFGTEFFI